MKVELLTLTGAKFSGTATELLLTTADGMLVVLPDHEPLTATLPPGPVTIHNGHQKDTFAIFGGILEVTPGQAQVMADIAEHSDELDQAEIEAALAQAEALKSAAGTHHELHRAQTMIDRSHVRLGVINIRRRRRTRAQRREQ